jgi:hypothetical protein
MWCLIPHFLRDSAEIISWEWFALSQASWSKGFFFDIPLDLVLARNAKRGASGEKLVSESYIREAFELLQKESPSPEEDFDVLIRIDENGVVTTLKGHTDSTLLPYFSNANDFTE